MLIAIGHKRHLSDREFGASTTLTPIRPPNGEFTVMSPVSKIDRYDDVINLAIGEYKNEISHGEKFTLRTKVSRRAVASVFDARHQEVSSTIADSIIGAVFNGYVIVACVAECPSKLRYFGPLGVNSKLSVAGIRGY